MQPIVFLVLLVLAVSSFIGGSASFYSRLPIALMEYSQRQDDFTGIGHPERFVQGRPARNAPLDLMSHPLVGRCSLIAQYAPSSGSAR